MGGFNGGARDAGLLRAVAIALIVGAVVALAVAVANGNGGAESEPEPAASDIVEGAVASHALHDLDPADLLAIPGSSNVLELDLNGGVDAGVFQGESLRFIESALSDIRELGSCGFVFLDANTGRGLACNADEALYIASAAKAPLAFYAVQHGAANNEADSANIEQAILYSDNDAFEAFGYNYTDEEYSSWLAAHEVFHEEYYYDLYPPMSARSLAAIWAEIREFAQSGEPGAGWFAGLLASTDTSFIRDALYDQDALVMSKAGWIASEDGEYQSVSDAAIIQVGNRTYLMAIVTSQPDWGMTEENVTVLARALFDARDEL